MPPQNASGNKKPNLKENPTDNKGMSEDKDKSKDKDSFIAVRWPSTLRKPLKVAAAGNDPPMTMTEYLTECFNKIQYEGGLSKTEKRSAPEVIPRYNDKEQRRRYAEASEKLFKTHDRRLIDLIILLLGYTTR